MMFSYKIIKKVWRRTAKDDPMKENERMVRKGKLPMMQIKKKKPTTQMYHYYPYLKKQMYISSKSLMGYRAAR